ncbi:MAG: folate family ECF transporter S component [Oscillospiraceae bacterium]|nr:folate family ECF transporter S component [Oscillospiraceae bacterium]
MKKFKFDTKTLAVMGVLIALEVVIAHFVTFRPTQTIKLSLDFLPIVIAGIMFGPVPAMIIGMLADILGAFIFPVGPYFPGFTLTAALTGLLYGFLLHRNQSMLRIIIAVAVQQWILSLLLNTFWLKILYGMPYVPTLVTRLPQTAILTAVQLIFIPIIVKVINQIRKRALT